MILVLLSALALTVVDRVRRMHPLDRKLLRQGSILFVPFLVMLALKFGLVIAMRARRIAQGDSTEPGAQDESLP